jgi:hypothetical protein
MTKIDRDKLLDRVRALFNKTVENGCTEAEAMAALTRARAMMDAYEITADDLKLAKEQAAILKHSEQEHDPHGIRWSLLSSVGQFCDCQSWGKSVRYRSRDRLLTFAGLPSDVDLAHWLLDSLTNFVLAALADHLVVNPVSKGERRLNIRSFVEGITDRLCERLNAETKKSKAKAADNSTQQGERSRALVVIKSAAIDALMEAEGIKVRMVTTYRRGQRNQDSYDAGYRAGRNASFGRPVETGKTHYLK